jgi:tRNA(Ile)-lysidine synthase
MHPLEKETLKIIRQEHLLKAGERVVIGVSAGPDSMALLHVLARLASVLDNTPAALYVNHGLRPAEAEKEHALVEAETRHLGIAFFSGNVNVKRLAKEKKISIEHAARLLRYDILEKTAGEWGAAKIALAHTADDQAEELLLRLVRGTARKGLAGMKTVRDGRIIRPFLGVAKVNLLEYLQKYSIPFLHDSSNSDAVYLRNRIRNDLLPYLASNYNPDIRQTLLRTANVLQDEEEFLENLTEAAFAETVSIIPKTYDPGRAESTECINTGQQGVLLNLEVFSRQQRAIQRRLLEKCFWHMDCEPSSRQIESILQLFLQNRPGGELHLSDGLRATIGNNQLFFSYPMGHGPFRGKLTSVPVPPLPETRIHVPGTYEFPGLKKKLVVELLDTVAVAGDIFSAGDYLDGSLFSFPLTLRGPRPGDRFHPLGAPGSRKVSDFLIDRKIDPHARRQIPVLCTDDDLILAIPGLRIDQRYRITEKTSRMVRITWEDMERKTEDLERK